MVLERCILKVRRILMLAILNKALEGIKIQKSLFFIKFITTSTKQNFMKYLIGPLLILLTLFSCKKNEIDFKTQQLLLLGKWELKSSAHDDSFVGEIKERSFDFGPDSVGIR